MWADRSTNLRSMRAAGFGGFWGSWRAGVSGVVNVRQGSSMRCVWGSSRRRNSGTYMGRTAVAGRGPPETTGQRTQRHGWHWTRTRRATPADLQSVGRPARPAVTQRSQVNLGTNLGRTAMPAWFESSPGHGPGCVVRVSTAGPASANQGGGPAGALTSARSLRLSTRAADGQARRWPDRRPIAGRRRTCCERGCSVRPPARVSPRRGPDRRRRGSRHRASAPRTRGCSLTAAIAVTGRTRRRRGRPSR